MLKTCTAQAARRKWSERRFNLAARAREARVTFPAVRGGGERGGAAAAAREEGDSDGTSSSLRPLPERDGPRRSALLLARAGLQGIHSSHTNAL